jgi:RNA polymerase sigma factor (sigma-70 family)
MDLYSIYKLAQAGDEQSILKLYNKFLPKIQKCGRNLYYDEAETDITIRFLEFIRKTNFDSLISKCDGAVISYTNKFFENTYKNLLISRGTHVPLIYLDDENSFTNDVTYYDDQSDLENDCFLFLTELQRKIIVYRYIYGYSIQEISDKLNVSRQAVNRTKNRAIKIIRSLYTDFLKL